MDSLGPPRIWFLRCMKCGNTIECSLDDVIRFCKTDCPHCCGEVMAVFSRPDQSLPT
jgi:hypothetical protein